MRAPIFGLSTTPVTDIKSELRLQRARPAGVAVPDAALAVTRGRSRPEWRVSEHLCACTGGRLFPLAAEARMSSLLKYSVLCLAGLAAACGQGNDLSAPPPDAPPVAGREVTATASASARPALAFSDSAIGFCYAPGTTRNCVLLSEVIRISAGGSALRWKASSDSPWIVVSPTRGTTPTRVRVSADRSKLPPGHGTFVWGSITVSAFGASNSPQTIRVKLQFVPSPPPR